VISRSKCRRKFRRRDRNLWRRRKLYAVSKPDLQLHNCKMQPRFLSPYPPLLFFLTSFSACSSSRPMQPKKDFPLLPCFYSCELRDTTRLSRNSVTKFIPNFLIYCLNFEKSLCEKAWEAVHFFVFGPYACENYPTAIRPH
jgi:hypothetical protein